MTENWGGSLLGLVSVAIGVPVGMYLPDVMDLGEPLHIISVMVVPALFFVGLNACVSLFQQTR